MVWVLRWLGRASLAALVLLFAASVWMVIQFQDWRNGVLAGLDAGSRVVQTQSGAVEYAEAGSGPVVLVCHGAPGGYDQALWIGEGWAKAGFRVIAPSRPGFLRTPLASGLLFEDQADAMAALLDALKIDRAAVVGFSTGAQVAVQLALRHPHRVAALVLLSPVTERYTREAAGEAMPLLSESVLYGLGGDMGSWLLVERARRDMGAVIGEVARADLKSGNGREAWIRAVRDSAPQTAALRALLDTLAPLGPRESGTRNDIQLVRYLQPVPWERISVPMLLVNGAGDSGSMWTSAAAVVKAIPGARHIEAEGAGHLPWFGPDASQTAVQVLDFLRAVPAAQASDISN